MSAREGLEKMQRTSGAMPQTRLPRNVTSTMHKTVAETLPESAEMEQIFASRSATAFLRSTEEQFFELVFLLLKQKAAPKWDRAGAYVGLAGDFFFSFLLCFSTTITWPRYVKPFQRVADILLLKTKAMNKEALYAVFSCVFVYFHVVLFVVCVSGYMIKRQISPHPGVLVFIRVSIFGIVHVFFYPMLSAVMAVMNCVHEGGDFVIDGINEVACFQGSHTPLFIFSFVTCALFLAFCYGMSLIYFDAAPKSRKYLSRPISRQECFILFSKTVFVMSTIFSKSSGVQSGLLFCFNLITLSIWILYPMYHRCRANQVRSVMFAINTWTSLFCCAYTNTPGSEEIGGFMVYVIGLPIVGYSLWRLSDDMKNIEQRMLLLNKEQLENKNITSSEQKIFANPFMVELATRTPLNPMKGNVTTVTLENTKYLYQQGIKKFPESIYVRINFTLFLLSYETYTDPSEIQMHLHTVLGMRRSSMDERYLCFYLKKLWQQDMEAKGLGFVGDGMQVTDFMYLKRQMILSSYLHAETKKCLSEFWRNLLKPGISETQIESKAEDFEVLEQMALSCYEGILRKFPRNKEALRSFGHFWMDIYRNEKIAGEYFSLADEIEEEESQKHSKARYEGSSSMGNSTNTPYHEMTTEGGPKLTTLREVEKTKKHVNDHESVSEYTTSSKEKSRLRLLKGKIKQIQNIDVAMESAAVVKFSRILAVLQILLFIIPLAGYAIFTNSLHLLQYNAGVLGSVHEQFNRFDEITYSVRSQILNHEVVKLGDGAFGCPSNEDCILESRGNVSLKISELLDTNVGLYEKLNPSFTRIREYLSTGSVNVHFYTGPNLDPVDEKLSFLEAMTYFGNAASDVLVTDIRANLEDNPSYLFVVNNGPTAIFNGLIHLEDLVLEQEKFLMNEFFITFGALMSTLVVSIITIAVIWVPNYIKVREEISALGKLRTIPRAEIISMCHLYRSSKESQEDDDLGSYVMSTRVLKKTYTNQRVSLLCSIFLAMIGFAIVIALGINQASTLSPVANEASLRKSYTASAYYKLRDLYLHSNVTEEMREDLAVMRENVMKSNNKLVMVAWGNPEEEKLLFGSCAAGVTLGIQRYVVDFMYKTMQDSYLALQLPHLERIKIAALNYSYSSFDGVVTDCMLNIQKYYHETAVQTREDTKVRGNVYFWIVWPLFFFTFGYYLPKLFRSAVGKTAARSARILKMIPIHVLESSSVLKDYVIDTGIIGLDKFSETLQRVQMHDSEGELVSVSRCNSRGSGGPRPRKDKTRPQGSATNLNDRDIESENEIDVHYQNLNLVTGPNFLSQPDKNENTYSSENMSSSLSQSIGGDRNSNLIERVSENLNCKDDSVVVEEEAPCKPFHETWQEIRGKMKGGEAVDIDMKLTTEVEEMQISNQGGSKKRKLCEICNLESACVTLHPCDHSHFCVSCVEGKTRCPTCLRFIDWREIIPEE